MDGRVDGWMEDEDACGLNDDTRPGEIPTTRRTNGVLRTRIAWKGETAGGGLTETPWPGGNHDHHKAPSFLCTPQASSRLYTARREFYNGFSAFFFF